jgi:hypothetical protein
MTAAVQTSGLTTHSLTAAVRLLAGLRWLALLLLINWLIIGGRRLAAVLRKGAAHPDFPLFAKRFGTDDCAAIRARVTAGLRRATALEAELLATGPTDPRLADITHCRAIGAQIVDIGRELGVFRDAPARITRRSNTTANLFPLTLAQPIPAATATCAHPTACPGLRAGATGPPSLIHRGDAESAELKFDDAGVPWNFSRRAPASSPLYALS